MVNSKIQEKFNKLLGDIFEKIWGNAQSVVNKSLSKNGINFYSDEMMYFFCKMWSEVDQSIKTGFWSSKEILILLSEQNIHHIQLGNDISSEFYEYCSKVLQEKVNNKFKSQNYECLQEAS